MYVTSLGWMVVDEGGGTTILSTEIAASKHKLLTSIFRLMDIFVCVWISAVSIVFKSTVFAISDVVRGWQCKCTKVNR